MHAGYQKCMQKLGRKPERKIPIEDVGLDQRLILK
jgi:hypothetical protein